MGTKNNIIKSMKEAGKSLGLFAVIATTIVAITYLITETRIADNEREALLKSLHELIPPHIHDNDIYNDTLILNEPTLNYRNKPVTVYRARYKGKHAAAIFEVIAPDGYTGAIKLLIAINSDNTIAGVRVINHKETPGLGDAIEMEKSNWITQFDNRSISNPTLSRWHVKKDGGDFDQLTGATITPRAIVKITKKTLQFFEKNHDIIFSQKTDSTTTHPANVHDANNTESKNTAGTH